MKFEHTLYKNLRDLPEPHESVFVQSHAQHCYHNSYSRDIPEQMELLLQAGY